MVQSDPNPYESPQAVAAEPAKRPIIPILRALIRAGSMGLIGFVSFSAFGFLYLGLAEYFQLEIFPSIVWALVVGMVGAAIFLGAELLNYGSGRITKLFNRIILACIAFVATGFVVSILIDSLGWNPQTYESDPWWLHRLVLLAVTYFATLAGLQVVRDSLDKRH